MLNIILGCEESQAVTLEFRALGFNAYSCDILDCSGGRPDLHIKGDILEVLKGGWFTLQNGDKVFITKWHAGIFFPPCTHLASSGAKHFAKKIADGRQAEGVDFFLKIANSGLKYSALENPVGVMSSKYRKPDQIIQPWQFGDTFQKTTCLWLRGFPKLEHTHIVDKGEFVTTPSGKRLPKWYSDNKSAKNRSKTFAGIAKAMAEQWGFYLQCMEL